MNSLSLNPNTIQSMNSLQIAELVDARHDSVKRTIERLADQEVFTLPPLVKTSFLDKIGKTQHTTVYVFSGEQGKLDSITVVAQLCPLFTARMVQRWQELENQVAQNTVTTTDPLSSIANNMQVLAEGMQVLAQASQTTMAKLDHTERYINLLELNQKGHIKITREVAQQVKDYKAQGYSQASIARLLRISPTSVNLIVHDKYNFAELPSDDHVTRMLETAKQLTLTVEQENNHE